MQFKFIKFCTQIHSFYVICLNALTENTTFENDLTSKNFQSHSELGVQKFTARFNVGFKIGSVI